MLPAICDNCRTIFPSGIFIENSTVSLKGNRSGPCPNCGGMGFIPDGYYDVREKVINIFTNSSISRERIRLIHDALNKAINSQDSPDSIIETLNNDAEELKPLLSSILPKTRAELYAFLRLILTFVMAIIQVINMSIGSDTATQKKSNTATITQEELDTAINRLEKRLTIPEKKEPSLAPQGRKGQYMTPHNKKEPYKAPYKPGRNELCPCQSGKKYKKCCGVQT